MVKWSLCGQKLTAVRESRPAAATAPGKEAGGKQCESGPARSQIPAALRATGYETANFILGPGSMPDVSGRTRRVGARNPQGGKREIRQCSSVSIRLHGEFFYC